MTQLSSPSASTAPVGKDHHQDIDVSIQGTITAGSVQLERSKLVAGPWRVVEEITEPQELFGEHATKWQYRLTTSIDFVGDVEAEIY